MFHSQSNTRSSGEQAFADWGRINFRWTTETSVLKVVDVAVKGGSAETVRTDKQLLDALAFTKSEAPAVYVSVLPKLRAWGDPNIWDSLVQEHEDFLANPSTKIKAIRRMPPNAATTANKLELVLDYVVMVLNAKGRFYLASNGTTYWFESVKRRLMPLESRQFAAYLANLTGIAPKATMVWTRVLR